MTSSRPWISGWSAAAAVLLPLCAVAGEKGSGHPRRNLSSGPSDGEQGEFRERRQQGERPKDRDQRERQEHKGHQQTFDRSRTPAGQRFSSSLPEHASIARDHALLGDIRASRGHDNVAGRYYRHAAGGKRYWHYQGQGVHWYGFYAGSKFYWTRWHRGFWWHYDPGSTRWVYWWGERWWPPGGGGGEVSGVDGVSHPFQPAVTAPTLTAPVVSPVSRPAPPAEDEPTAAPEAAPPSTGLLVEGLPEYGRPPDGSAASPPASAPPSSIMPPPPPSPEDEAGPWK